MGIERLLAIIKDRRVEHTQERETRLLETLLSFIAKNGGGNIDPFIAQMEAVGYSREELESALCNTDI